MIVFNDVRKFFKGMTTVLLIKFGLKKESELFKFRESICNDCPYIMNKHSVFKKCMICGCYIKPKTHIDYPFDSDGLSIGGCPYTNPKW